MPTFAVDTLPPMNMHAFSLHRASVHGTRELHAESVPYRSPGSAQRRSREAPPWVSGPKSQPNPERVAEVLVEPFQGSLPVPELSTQGGAALTLGYFMQPLRGLGKMVIEGIPRRSRGLREGIGVTSVR